LKQSEAHVKRLDYLRHFVIALVALAVGATTTEAARVLWTETPVDAARPERTADPVEAQIRREILARAPELRQKPAPFLRVEIPDPLATARQLSLREQPADSSTPIAASGIAPRPVLPVAQPPGAK